MDKKKPYSEYLKEKFPAKAKFVERIEALIGVADAEKFFEISYTKTPVSIRCNTLKISVDELLKRLKAYGWDVRQPFDEFPEVIIIDSRLEPGELGKTKEHLLDIIMFRKFLRCCRCWLCVLRLGKLFWICVLLRGVRLLRLRR